MAIEAVLLDYCQTLVDSSDGFRAAEKLIQEKIFEDLALTDWEEFLEDYRRIRKQAHEKLVLSREAIWQEVYWYYCREPHRQDLQRWESEYWLQVSTTTVIFPETSRVLEALAAKYKLALITNADARTSSAKEQIDHYPQLKAFFDVIVLAGKDDVPAKPDPAAFIPCLEALGVRPDQAVYVGDDWRIDICGARGAGIQPIWIQHHTVPRTFPDVETSTPIITSLDPLLDLDRVLGR
ncbi:hypothetical protein LCGC14_0018970 [marine sediment metagenome]|uniref:HAD family hydrolase n=1 Tax=marine sediment metagenome TaxID=412755 RepID=A0A0F9W294_9ZZZZ|nr:HAD family hydrolase [Phycisphaerae bacterium]HDZ44427.1 HAD family hydrolase [Phycisphaerae bacterium]